MNPNLMLGALGLLLAVASSALACTPAVSTVQAREVQALSDRIAAHDEGVDAVAARAAALSARWAGVEAEYSRAEADFASAAEGFEQARRDGDNASAAYESARVRFEDAERAHRFYQRLILVAAALDGAKLDSSRAGRTPARRGATAENDSPSPISCSPMSTAAFRRELIAAGMDLTGIDIDHIVPRSLGGADDRSNYQLLPSSVNRSLGARWDRAKCLMAAEKCATAVAVSRACGTYQGTVP